MTDIDTEYFYYTSTNGSIYQAPDAAKPGGISPVYQSSQKHAIGSIIPIGDKLIFYEAGTGVCEVKTDGTEFKVIENFLNHTISQADSFHETLPEMVLIGEFLIVNFRLPGIYNDVLQINRRTGEIDDSVMPNSQVDNHHILYYDSYFYAVPDKGNILRSNTVDPFVWETVPSEDSDGHILLDGSYIYKYKSERDGLYKASYGSNNWVKMDVYPTHGIFTMAGDWLFYEALDKAFGQSVIRMQNKQTADSKVVAAGGIDMDYGLYIIASRLYYMKNDQLMSISIKDLIDSK